MKKLFSRLECKTWKEDLPLFFRSRGSVILVIWPQVLFGILYSVAIVCIHKYSGHPFPEFPTTFIPVLGLVIGLLLVFRTTTGYDRYYEGRKLWSDMTYRIRTLSRCTWLGVKDEGNPELIIQKRTAINLLVAFAYATKNYLRGEYSYDEDSDIHRLTLHLPRIQDENNKGKSYAGNSSSFSSSRSPSRQSTLNADEDKGGITISRSQSQGKLSTKSVSIDLPESLADELAKEKNDTKKDQVKKMTRNNSSGRVTMSVRRKVKKATSIETELDKRGSIFQAHDTVTPTNIPMELVYYYQTWVYKVVKEEKVDGTTAMFMLSFTNELMNILAQLERILRTPIPLAYSIHLHQSVWLYMLTLPFQIVGNLGWITVPGMALACFALLGILAIGWEIENPFGYDDNDLPLDEFCEVIQHEVGKFAKQAFPDPESWIFTRENKPFTQTELSALDLKGLEDLEFHAQFLNAFRVESMKMKEAANNKEGNSDDEKNE